MLNRPVSKNKKESVWSEIFEQIHQSFPTLTLTQIKEISDFILSDIVRYTEQTGRTEIRKFGVFSVQLRRPRKIKIPTKADVTTLPYRHTLSFKPSHTLKSRINNQT